MLRSSMKPNPTQAAASRAHRRATSPRAGCKLDAAEQAAFLNTLAATGNFAFACEAIGRVKSGLYKRRARDPDFRARCDLSLAKFRGAKKLSSPPRGCSRPSAVRRTAGKEQDSDACRQAGAAWRGALEHSQGNSDPNLHYLPPRGDRPAQLRRLPAGSLTAAGEADFLAAFAATGNVRLAAEHVGVSASTIHRRRNLDARFAAAFAAAADTARQSLEDLFMERAAATYDPEYRAEHTHGLDLVAQDKVMPGDILRFLAWLERRGRR